jgi:hypothetical protein
LLHHLLRAGGEDDCAQKPRGAQIDSEEIQQKAEASVEEQKGAATLLKQDQSSQ